MAEFKKERDLEEDMIEAYPNIEYPPEFPAFELTYQKPELERGYYNPMVKGTHISYLEYYANVIEYRIYYKFTLDEIAMHLSISKSTVYQILKKYYPVQGDRDIAMTIMSKV